jgi:hypothetical protein
MAARRYFRKGEAELPKGGAWTYRGTQVVTGAEARKVAAEQAAERRRAAEADELLRSRAPGPTPGPRQAFSHDPKPAATSRGPATTETAARPATSRSATPPVPPAPPPPAAPAAPAKVEPGSSLLGRVRRALGLG